ncbi:helix-turn-helix domain-containing protein [Acidisoma silvae]|uniref:XRE family transcriptional regulator n=1 Tax=Acidisoma silvae TaxID=2802396 RepID=A0A963YYC6_9PROT|nr:XRE family transcriptional regulator [Acidisoma silvae]MCB8878483.1 XRE family transcriptional regulator [Acidisoma silvae]
MTVMDIRVINTEQDYRWAMNELDGYFENEPEVGTPDGDRLTVLSILVEDYERRIVGPIQKPAPHEAVKMSMEFRGATQADLAKLLGSRPKASELLAGKRSISAQQAVILHEAWNIPLDVLITRPAKKPRRALKKAVGPSHPHPA